jgi:hypothetical protein
MQVPGLAALNTSGRETFVAEISRAAAGSCAAGHGAAAGRAGGRALRAGRERGWFVRRRRWRPAESTAMTC